MPLKQESDKATEEAHQGWLVAKRKAQEIIHQGEMKIMSEPKLRAISSGGCRFDGYAIGKDEGVRPVYRLLDEKGNERYITLGGENFGEFLETIVGYFAGRNVYYSDRKTIVKEPSGQLTVYRHGTTLRLTFYGALMVSEGLGDAFWCQQHPESTVSPECWPVLLAGLRKESSR